MNTRIGRRLALVVLALSLLVGFPATAVDATPTTHASAGVIAKADGVQMSGKGVKALAGGYYYLPAGQYIQAVHGSCVARFIYGNFGSVAFTRMEALNFGCSTLSRVMTQAWGDTSTACSYLHQHSSYPDCDHADNWVQAVAVGTLIGGYWQVHDGASSGEVWFTPIQ